MSLPKLMPLTFNYFTAMGNPYPVVVSQLTDDSDRGNIPYAYNSNAYKKSLANPNYKYSEDDNKDLPYSGGEGISVTTPAGDYTVKWTGTMDLPELPKGKPELSSNIKIDADRQYNVSPIVWGFLKLCDEEGIQLRVSSMFRPDTGSKTASGGTSRHTEGCALDITPLNTNVYDRNFNQLIYDLVSNPRIVAYMEKYMGGFLDEYSTKNPRQKGAAGPHIHVSFKTPTKNYGEASAVRDLKDFMIAIKDKDFLKEMRSYTFVDPARNISRYYKPEWYRQGGKIIKGELGIPQGILNLLDDPTIDSGTPEEIASFKKIDDPIGDLEHEIDDAEDSPLADDKDKLRNFKSKILEKQNSIKEKFKNIDDIKTGFLQSGVEFGKKALNAIEDATMGDKEFGALSAAIDAGVHGLSSAMIKSGNPYGIIAGAALEVANFNTKATGQNIQGYKVDISSSGYGNLGEYQSKANRDFASAIGLGGLNATKIENQLKKRNELALLALKASNVSDTIKFEQEARTNSVDNVVQANLIALAGGIDTSLLTN